MTITELGAIGELVGGVAVVASLVYVGLQVRLSAEQTRQTNAIEKARAHRDMERGFGEVFRDADEHLLKICRAALVDFDALSKNEQALLHHRYLIPIGMNITATFHAAKTGLVDEAWAQSFTRYWASIVMTPGIATWWRQMKGEFQPDFAASVDRFVAERGGRPPINIEQPWLMADEPSQVGP